MRIIYFRFFTAMEIQCLSVVLILSLSFLSIFYLKRVRNDEFIWYLVIGLLLL